MAHWQLFVPHKSGCDPQHLIGVGCADLVADAMHLDLPEGPGNVPGILVAWPRPGDHRHEYRPAEQTWIPAVPRDGLPAARYHVGLWTADLPTPDQLRRPYPYRGSEHDLGGRTWLLPREFDLPRDCVLADDGTWRFERQRRFADFGAAVETIRHRWLAEMRRGPDDPVDRPVRLVEVFDLLLAALRLNYRLLPELVNPLRLFDTESYAAPFEAVIGAA